MVESAWSVCFTLNLRPPPQAHSSTEPSSTVLNANMARTILE